MHSPGPLSAPLVPKRVMHRWGAFRYFAVTPTHITPRAIRISETRARLEKYLNGSVNGFRVGVAFGIQKVSHGHFAQREEISANG